MKVGDIVYVKDEEFFKSHDCYTGYDVDFGAVFTNDMFEFCKKPLTIRKFGKEDIDGKYRPIFYANEDEGYYMWEEWMINLDKQLTLDLGV